MSQISDGLGSNETRKVVSSAKGANQGIGNGFVFPGGHFDDQSALETITPEFAEEPRPVDAAFAGNEMGVAVTEVVVDVNHPEVAGEFVHHGAEVAAEPGVAGIETGADGAGVDRAEKEHEVAGRAEEQVRQHVFKLELNALFAAKGGDLIE